MLLAIDVGNTNIVFGLMEMDGTLRGSFRLPSDRYMTGDEIGLLVSGYFARFGHDPKTVEAAIIDSVVPGVMRSLKTACEKYFGCTPVVVDEDVDSGLRYAASLGQAHERVGADRSTTGVAALAKYGAPLILLDLGTATTIDAFDADGCYLGGTICTGLRMTMNALTDGTAMLPDVPLDMPDHVIGRNTIEQIQAGIVGGYVGNLEYIIRRMTQEIGAERVRVVATGGLAELIAAHTAQIEIVDRDLTLDGLYRIYTASRR